MKRTDHLILWLGAVPALLNGLVLLGMDQTALGLVGIVFGLMLVFVFAGRFPRFSLRTLLIGVTVLSILFGILAVLKQVRS